MCIFNSSDHLLPLLCRRHFQDWTLYRDVVHDLKQRLHVLFVRNLIRSAQQPHRTSINDHVVLVFHQLHGPVEFSRVHLLSVQKLRCSRCTRRRNKAIQNDRVDHVPRLVWHLCCGIRFPTDRVQLHLVRPALRRHLQTPDLIAQLEQGDRRFPGVRNAWRHWHLFFRRQMQHVTFLQRRC